MNHTTQRQHELESRYRQLSNHIEALYTDLGRTNQEHEKLPLREKLADAQQERAQVAAQLDALESGQPVEAGAGGLFDSPNYAAQRQAYLAALAERYNWVSTAAFTEQAGPQQTGKAHRLPLLDSASQTGVYVPLLFDPVGDPRPRPKARSRGQEEELAQTSRLDLDQVLAEPAHLAIVGAAGSGKTTLLRIVMALLTDPDPAGVAPELAAVLPQPRPLPVFLPLRLFEFACTQPDAPYQRTQASLLRFLDDWFCQGCSDLALPPRFLAEHVLAGRAWLLLDALDEVADPAHRRTIRNVIANDLLVACKGSRVVVTARVAGYRDAPLDSRFRVVQVAPLDAEQRAAMVRKLYRGLALADHERRAADLLQRMETRPDLAFLTTTPVMVWTAAVIHAFRGNLPDGRAALYDAYVDILLRKSFDLGEFEVEALQALEGAWNLPDRKQGLSYGAFAAHRWLEDPERRASASDEARRSPVITVRDLADDFLAGYFKSQAWAADAREARQQAREFAALMAERSGILIEEADGFRFGDHLTMQEFLAGRYLGEYYRQDDPASYTAFVGEKYGAAWWREVFLLGIGYLAAKGGRDGLDLLRLLARQGAAPAQRLAALEVAGTACAQLAVLQAPPRWYEQARSELAGQLYDALWGAPLAAPIPARHLAGLALGRLWGWEGDPRFQGPLGLPDFVAIPAGPFSMGRDDSVRENERPAHRVHLAAYAIARFPTTNAMFKRFLDAGGYDDPGFWPEAIADERWENGIVRDWSGQRTEPLYWTDERWNNPAQPVVGVTWYEAMAYCHWLSAETGQPHRLPTEAQWEKAAAFDPAANVVRRYPWGDRWQEGMANSQEARLQQTCIAGLFAGDRSAAGVQDLAGNVNEWVADWYGSYPKTEVSEPTGPKIGEFKVLRGSSWIDEGQDWCRCSYRNGNNPGDGSSYRGFRCARTSS